MLRTTSSKPIILTYDIDNEPLIISQSMMKLFYTKDHPTDLIGLYTFYYLTAKNQKTNLLEITTSKTADYLKWSEDRVRKTKKVLTDLGLIKNKIIVDNLNRIRKHVIQIKFMWTGTITTLKKPYSLKSHTIEIPEDGSPIINNHYISYNDSNINNLINEEAVNSASSSSSKPKPSLSTYINLSMFEKFWKIYPRKASKGQALVAWTKLCKQPLRSRPTWRILKSAVRAQMSSERWQNPKFIPFASTWLNQNRWLDDPNEMISFSPDIRKPNTIGYRENGKTYRADDLKL